MPSITICTSVELPMAWLHLQLKASLVSCVMVGMPASLVYALQDEKQAYVITEACYGGTLEDFLRVRTALLISAADLCVLQDYACLDYSDLDVRFLVLQQSSCSPAFVAHTCIL